jgi:hypothetical protein
MRGGLWPGSPSAAKLFLGSELGFQMMTYRGEGRRGGRRRRTIASRMGPDGVVQRTGARVRACVRAYCGEWSCWAVLDARSRDADLQRFLPRTA